MAEGKGPTPYLAVYNEGPMLEVPGASGRHSRSLQKDCQINPATS